jgi:hypothetical protein
MVNILDEIDSLSAVETLASREKGKKVSELTEADGKFSYRYAVGQWEERDDRIQAFAENAARLSGQIQ